MFRLKLVMIVLGAMLAWWGFQEFRVSSGTTTEPIDVNLADVEAGRRPDNNHWRLGEHMAVYNACVYEYEQAGAGGDEPAFDAKVNHCYYPVVSHAHPLIAQLNDFKAKFGGLAIAPHVALPPPNDFAVIIKSKEFATVGAIPDDWGSVQSLQGLVINSIGSLDAEEAKMFREGFPGLDTDKLVILEAGRTPASGLKSGGMVAGGVLASLVGLAWMAVGRRRA